MTVTILSRCGVLALALGLAGVAVAQTDVPVADLAGTWVAGATEGGRGGRGGGGVPGFPAATQLVITVSPAEVTVESDTGSARSIQRSVYRLDGTTTTVPGPLGWDTTAKAAIEAGQLVVTVTRSIEGPNGPVGVDVTDIYRVDGDVLTIGRSQGRTTQTLVFARKR